MTKQSKSNMPPVVDLAHKAAKEHSRALGLDKLAPGDLLTSGNNYAAAWLDAFHYLKANPSALKLAPIPNFEYYPKESS